ncbi:hypothetical protein B4U79_15852 [Dinothrombium tinctorium]|uniref:Sushi domain-containing protein n=1 Tax=Dinothrombium tinctorium TaxID=1965070 RepID=A0A443RNF7_9ACAR|nr:hypothetical protein B4U79_15852 [Dinothrombium tinctorium]
MIDCEESITFFCRGMFPKPSPACGLYNDLTGTKKQRRADKSCFICAQLKHLGTYIKALSFDRVEKRPDDTYEVSFFRRFFARDYLEFRGHMSFRCYIIIVSTTWRRGVHHKMFGDAGCVEKIPEIPNGYYNLTPERTCWNTPRDGSRLAFGCNENYELVGESSFVCADGSWKPESNQTLPHWMESSDSAISDGSFKRQPVCSK